MMQTGENTSGMSAGVYYDSFSLDNSWVNKTGDTKYQLRSSRDVNGDEPYENEYIGFYSANSAGNEPMLKVTYTTTAPEGHYSICGDSNYKVMANLSQPPDKPITQTESWRVCGGMPEIAYRTSLILKWLYSDPEEDLQAAYEVWVDDDINFTGLKFNHLVEHIPLPGPEFSYTLNLDDDDDLPDPGGDWLSEFPWGVTYYWKVRIKDTNGNWSEFSDPDSFKVPDRASPYISFTVDPVNPGIDEVVSFIDSSKCYLSDNSDYFCKNGGAEITYEWDFDDGSPIDTTEGNTAHTYFNLGRYIVQLKITDENAGDVDLGIGICWEEVLLGIPIPEWKEITPF